MTAADRALATQGAVAALGVLGAAALAILAVDALELRDAAQLARELPGHLVAAAPIAAAVAAALVVARWRAAGVWDGLVAVGARPSRLAVAVAGGVALAASAVVAIGPPPGSSDLVLDGDAVLVQTPTGWERAEVRGDRVVTAPSPAPPAPRAPWNPDTAGAVAILALGSAAAASRGGVPGMRWIAVATVWQLGRLGVSEAVARGAWPGGWLVAVWAAALAATAQALVDADR